MVILKEKHDKIVRALRRRAFIIHGLLCAVIAFAVVVPWAGSGKLEVDIVRESYRLVRENLFELECRYALLEVLRTKPLSVGQALEVADVVLDEARFSKVPMHMVLGVISCESGFRTDAVSIAGARGLMQVMPATWKLYVDDKKLGSQTSVHSPALNVRVGVRYLGDLLKQYGDWKKVLKAYGGFVSESPDKYVSAVMVRSEEFRRILGTEDGNSLSTASAVAAKVRQ